MDEWRKGQGKGDNGGKGKGDGKGKGMYPSGNFQNYQGYGKGGGKGKGSSWLNYSPDSNQGPSGWGECFMMMKCGPEAVVPATCKSGNCGVAKPEAVVPASGQSGDCRRVRRNPVDLVTSNSRDCDEDGFRMVNKGVRSEKAPGVECPVLFKTAFQILNDEESDEDDFEIEVNNHEFPKVDEKQIENKDKMKFGK